MMYSIYSIARLLKGQASGNHNPSTIVILWKRKKFLLEYLVSFALIHSVYYFMSFRCIILLSLPNSVAMVRSLLGFACYSCFRKIFQSRINYHSDLEWVLIINLTFYDYHKEETSTYWQVYALQVENNPVQLKSFKYFGR